MTMLACPHCGDLNPAGTVRCETCGYGRLVLTQRELEPKRPGPRLLFPDGTELIRRRGRLHVEKARRA